MKLSSSRSAMIALAAVLSAPAIVVAQNNTGSTGANGTNPPGATVPNQMAPSTSGQGTSGQSTTGQTTTGQNTTGPNSTAPDSSGAAKPPAVTQNTPPPSSGTTPRIAPPAMTPTAPVASDTSKPMMPVAGTTARSTYVTADQHMRSSKIVGASVYNERNEKVGSIDDVLIGDKAEISGVVISVGGFLGMAGKLVEVPFSRIQVNNDKLTIAGATKDQLTNLPEYKYAGS